MMRMMTSKGKRAGFTLIELAIVLAVTSLLTAGLWRMMSSGNTQLRDQAAADQQRELISAVRGFLASADGQAIVAAHGNEVSFTLPLPTSNTDNADCRANLSIGAPVPAVDQPRIDSFCDFLPLGFEDDTTNSYNQTYEVRVLKDDTAAATAPQFYSFMIKTTGGETIPDTSGGRISSMIGNDGGFVYNADVCGASWACGAFGSWSANPVLPSPGGYAFDPANMADGQIATRTFVGMNASLNAPWLARIDVAGDADPVANGIDDYNTIQTDTSLGGNDIFGIGNGTDPGGELVNFRRISLSRDAAQNIGSGNMLNIVSDCFPPDLISYDSDPLNVANYTCDYAVNITGGVAINGLLTADSLYAGTFIYDTTSSDKRLKTEIELIKSPLERIAKLNGYSFFVKGQEGKKYGVIAQEVETQFPELVHESANALKSVDYMGLIGPLVAAVKELKEQNESLKKEIEALKTLKK